MIALHAALLSRKAERPVRTIYDRHEDIAATTKRHPAIVRHRTGVTSDGRLLAQDIEVVMDGGAYCTLTPVVLSRGALHAGGPYRCPNVRIRARATRTNTPPNGAFRGFGAPQVEFATETHLKPDRRATRTLAPRDPAAERLPPRRHDADRAGPARERRRRGGPRAGRRSRRVRASPASATSASARSGAGRGRSRGRRCGRNARASPRALGLRWPGTVPGSPARARSSSPPSSRSSSPGRVGCAS